jgi:transposase
MTAPITLPELDAATLAELRQRYEETSNAESRTRYQMVLLAQQEYTVPQIARIVLRSEDTVARVLHRFVAGGLNAVPRRTQPGRKRRITAAWEAGLLRVIELDPTRRSDRKRPTGRPSCSLRTWASRQGSRSQRKRCACTYMLMATSASAPSGH